MGAKLVVDQSTGEVLTDYTIRHRNQDEAYKKMQKRGKDTRHFSLTHMKHIREVTNDLSNTYCGYVVMLQPYIEYETNVILDGKKEPAKRAALAKILKVSPRTVKAVVTELKGKEIIYEEDGCFTVNPRYHLRGKTGAETQSMIKTFFSTVKCLDVKAADLGFVYKLLPNVHLETNMICNDPFCASGEIRFLNEKQIGDLVGMSEKKARETLARLRKAGVVGVWHRAKDSREKLTVLNPYIFYRKSGQPDGTLDALFTSKSYVG